MRQMRRASFRQWLLSKDPEAIVGVQNGAGSCPLAVYMGGRTRILWTVYYVKVATQWLKRKLTAWAQAFVRAMDSATLTSRVPHEIQAWQALQILDRIP
jgi:hypothetical protein